MDDTKTVMLRVKFDDLDQLRKLAASDRRTLQSQFGWLVSQEAIRREQARAAQHAPITVENVAGYVWQPE